MELLKHIGILALVITVEVYCVFGLLVLTYFVRCTIDEIRGKKRW